MSAGVIAPPRPRTPRISRMGGEISKKCRRVFVSPPSRLARQRGHLPDISASRSDADCSMDDSNDLLEPIQAPEVSPNAPSRHNLRYRRIVAPKPRVRRTRGSETLQAVTQTFETSELTPVIPPRLAGPYVPSIDDPRAMDPVRPSEPRPLAAPSRQLLRPRQRRLRPPLLRIRRGDDFFNHRMARVAR